MEITLDDIISGIAYILLSVIFIGIIILFTDGQIGSSSSKK